MSKITTDEYGNQFWKNEEGQYHRVDGPAVIHANGKQEWYINGVRHRIDGPAIIWANGSQYWFINGLCHRLDGPAYIGVDGTQQWFINGLCHRENGPAIIWADGRQQWWVDDINLTNQVKSWIKENDFPDHTLWTDTQKIMFRLAFSGITS